MKNILTIIGDEENKSIELSTSMRDPKEICALLIETLVRVAVENDIPWKVLIAGIKAYEPYEEEAE